MTQCWLCRVCNSHQRHFIYFLCLLPWLLDIACIFAFISIVFDFLFVFCPECSFAILACRIVVVVAAIRSPHRVYSDVLVAHGLEAMCNLMDNNKANRDRLDELRACAGVERAIDLFQSP